MGKNKKKQNNSSLKKATKEDVEQSKQTIDNVNKDEEIQNLPKILQVMSQKRSPPNHKK